MLFLLLLFCCCCWLVVVFVVVVVVVVVGFLLLLLFGGEGGRILYLSARFFTPFIMTISTEFLLLDCRFDYLGVLSWSHGRRKGHLEAVFFQKLLSPLSCWGGGARGVRPVPLIVTD